MIIVITIEVKVPRVCSKVVTNSSDLQIVQASNSADSEDGPANTNSDEDDEDQGGAEAIVLIYYAISITCCDNFLIQIFINQY